ncbi:MAG: Ig-like domain-containing protein [Clostridia bacterium]|nr:Ig-like domain-containing protein [Clostridia bacterium]
MRSDLLPPGAESLRGFAKRLLRAGTLLFALGTAAAVRAAEPLPTPTPVPTGLAVLPGFETMTLFGGGTDQIEVTKDSLDYGALHWESSDPSVALVEEHGVVIALKKGECTVTGTDADGSGQTVETAVRVTGDRKKPAVPKSLQGLCYRRKEKFSVAERRSVERIVNGLKQKVSDGTADTGERIACAALGYLGRNYGTRKDHVDCSMLLFWSAYDCGLSVSRRSDWQAEELLPYEVTDGNYRAGDFLFLGAQEGDSCRCDGECTRFRRIHHAAVLLAPYEEGWLVVEASSVLKRVVIRLWDGSPVHAGFDVASVSRPAARSAAER